MPGERKIGIALDFSKSSKNALKWTIDNLIDKDDTLFVIHVKSIKGDESRNNLWIKDGSPLIPLSEFKETEVMKQYGVEADPEALGLLDQCARQKQANVVAKLLWGDAREKLCDAVEDLKLDSLVIGSRGLGAVQRILLGSVSSYVLSHATCPITIVKN